VALVAVAVGGCGKINAGASPQGLVTSTTSTLASPINCPTANSPGCYYVKTNRPVHLPFSVVYDGQTVPVVGVVSPNAPCLNRNGCYMIGAVGPYAVWNTGSNGTTHLVAVYSPGS
jgi:hypothetical protein